MGAPIWIECFTGPLERRGIPYMITGSVASMVYAEPRTTLDVDLVVELTVDAVPAFLDAFPEDQFYRPPLEVVRQECARDSRGHFNLIHHATGFKADVYPAGLDPLHRWALDRRRRLDDPVVPVTLAPPEYVILRKLEFWREGGSSKHLRDVAGMLVAGVPLELPFLEQEIQHRGLQEAWARVRS